MVKVPIDILIVDDEPDFLEMLGLRLEDAGHKVRTALNGLDGLKALEEREGDVVILDIKMEGLDGIEILKRIKVSHPIVEVILLTGHGTIQTAIEGMKSGSFDYLLKPADFEELIEKLENARKRKYEHEERIRQAEARALLRRGGNV